MALSFAESSRSVWGDKREVVTVVTFDSSYPTGGEAITPSQFGLVAIEYVDANPLVSVDNDVYWDQANSKLFVTVRSTGAQVADTTSLATLTAQLRIVGR